jgi:carbon storage regulator CsrA
MLVLSRKSRESVVVGGVGGLDRVLKVTVLAIAAGKVKLGFEVDGDIPVHRLEVWEQIHGAGEAKNRGAGRDAMSLEFKSPEK